VVARHNHNHQTSFIKSGDNMDIFKVIGIGIVAALFGTLLKPQKPEIAMQITIAASVIIFIIIAPYLNTVVSVFKDISVQAGIESDYFMIVLKIIGISYAAQIAIEICRDVGQGAVAAKLEIASKLIIMVMSVPVMYKMLSVVTQLLSHSG